ncbi:hypothetical protein PGB34_11270 [Xenophilus arseniciresistens]|uniref:Uncharacterized protein n=1 Tax=Xenophilus arseniciresistens TaxID=1283306 RepID=A0AAE3T0I0_9BURK|nr:hypothetical protein [Xenophilus arseniciresistens]MDA7416946.1 hypothetical protein [Xenophilus arseniciresistens]
MRLDYLLFEASEGDDGIGLFEAMADVPLARAAAVQAEIDAVLAWAQRHFGSARGPVEEGGEWDAHLETDDTLAGRRSFTFSVVGAPGFCAAFAQAFDTDAFEA